MQYGITRLVTVAAAFVTLGSCDKTPPFAPAEDLTALTVVSASAVGTSPNLTSIAVSPVQIDLAWQDNSNAETGFEVHRSTTGPGDSFTGIGTTGANVTSYGDAGLTGGTEYCYRIRAFKTSGRKTSYSEFSNTACTTTLGPPPAPSNGNATPTSSSAVDVAWIDQSTSEDGFRVERASTSAGPWENVASTAANVTSYRDLERPGEQQVCYRVIAFNTHGESPPSNSDCTTAPAGPTSLTGTEVNRETILLTWTDNSTVEDRYEIQRSSDGVTFYTLATVPANSSSYWDVGVPAGMTFWYRVRAQKDGGYSDFSNVAAAMTGSCAPYEWDCYNGIDDDCDGYVDHIDVDCGCGSEGCG